MFTQLGGGLSVISASPVSGMSAQVLGTNFTGRRTRKRHVHLFRVRFFQVVGISVLGQVTQPA